jgi:hypothetical protein
MESDGFWGKKRCLFRPKSTCARFNQSSNADWNNDRVAIALFFTKLTGQKKKEVS